MFFISLFFIFHAFSRHNLITSSYRSCSKFPENIFQNLFGIFQKNKKIVGQSKTRQLGEQREPALSNFKGPVQPWNSSIWQKVCQNLTLIPCCKIVWLKMTHFVKKNNVFVRTRKLRQLMSILFNVKEIYLSIALSIYYPLEPSWLFFKLVLISWTFSELLEFF